MGICILAQQILEEWKLQWLSAPPLWVIFLLLIPAAALFSWFLYRNEKGSLTTGWKILLIGLRFALFVFIFCVLFEPVLSLVKHEKRSGYILVLLDTSQSMGFTDEWVDPGNMNDAIKILGPGITSGSARMKRIEVVKRILSCSAGEWVKDLGKKGKLRLLTFSRKGEMLVSEDIPRGEEKGLNEVLKKVSELEIRKKGGDETHIANAIQEAVLSLRGKKITAIVVFSDWQQTGGDLTLESLPAELRRPEGTIPVMAVGIGSPVWPQDTKIVNFTGPRRALIGDTVSFSVTVAGTGCAPGTTTRLDLLVNGVPSLNAKYPTIREDGGSETVRIEHKFQESGLYDVSVKLEPLSREVDESNNVETRQIEIKEQSLKILYVENLPRWDYRYLKNFLIRDPTLRFQALLLSADPRFRQETSLHPPLEPLTKFPQTRAELFAYDVLIIGDVDPTGEFSNNDLENIRAFVSEGGGGIVFIAGENYNPTAFAHTPLADALPVEVEDLGIGSRFQRQEAEKPFRIKLTPEGLKSPIMTFVSDKDRNRDLWENTDGLEYNSLPGFWWFAPVMRLKKGAIALGIHPFKKNIRYGPRVIFATQIYGKGRTFFSAVDSTWRWRAVGGGKYFKYFWGQAIRFVAASRLRGETARFQLNVDKTIYHPGEHVLITATVLDEELRPSTRNQWKIILKGSTPDATGREILLKQDDPTRPGSFTGSMEAGSFGMYTLFFKDHEKVRTSFRVVVPKKEQRDIRMNKKAALKLSKATGGTFYNIDNVMSLPGKVVPVSQELSVTTSRNPVWSKWWIIVALVFLACLEWGLRKIRRLL